MLKDYQQLFIRYFVKPLSIQKLLSNESKIEMTISVGIVNRTENMIIIKSPSEYISPA